MFITDLTWIIIISGVTHSAFGLNVHEVSVGDTVKLPCLSNDHDHRFQYWQLVNDEILGPWNNWKSHKIKYEVTTGELTIKSISKGEAGLYKCISKSLTGPGLYAETVELVVKRDWEEMYEDDTTLNTYRALIVVFCFLILLLLGILAFVIARRRRLRGSFEEFTDDVMIRSNGTYKPTTTDRRSRGASNEALVIDTDMRTSFSLPDYG